ncbi:MAG: RIP metalloprotease RseP [Polyangiaceae bacterium]|nr:RIP metalloprotease RseP [Polyangiaceae bacterium]
MDLLYFVILVSTLVFVHEMGHFVMAKLFGVKVITFSLGFGPKILRLRGQETEYCVGLLPLGGYVSMLEESKGVVVHFEDRHRTFESQSIIKRLIIVLAGPMMNLIFPVILYFAVFVTSGPFLAPTVGVVLPGHPAEGKLRPGDRIMAIDGEDVGTFDEVKRKVRRNPSTELIFKVFRDNEHVEVPIVTDEKIDEKLAHQQLDIVERIGTIGVQPSAPAAVIGVSDPDSPAHRAQLRTFDVVTHVAGKPVRRFMDLEAAIAENRGETVPIAYRRPVNVENALGGLANMAVYESGVVALTPLAGSGTLKQRTGMELADLYAAVVPDDSYLYKAGLRSGDKILTLDDEPVPAWSTFRERVLAAPDQAHHIEYLPARGGRARSGTFRMRREDFTDEHGTSFSRYVLRVRHWIVLAPEKFVDHPSPISYALGAAVRETADVTRFILVGLVRLAQGRISLDSLSGPITIYEVAGEEGRKGPDYFMWVMALLSINLGLLNLLPIPVLDGGHLMFFTLEAVMRRPLPVRVREVAHLLGMALIFLLMVLAFRNDLGGWDVILGQLKQLVG